MASTTTSPKRKSSSSPKRKSTKQNKKSPGDIAASYNKYKVFDGKQYTGMQVGRSHKWYYDKGEWKETKITPDLWRIFYAVTKRRAGRAPRGSGAKVGTGYQWFILANQKVTKLNANDYSTSLSGLKYKLSHKRADKNKWNASAATQRAHLIKFLKEIIHQLEKEAIPIKLEYDGIVYKGEGVPIAESCVDGTCYQLDVSLNNENFGIIRRNKSGWKMDQLTDQKMVDAIGEQITEYYQ